MISEVLPCRKAKNTNSIVVPVAVFLELGLTAYLCMLVLDDTVNQKHFAEIEAHGKNIHARTCVHL